MIFYCFRFILTVVKSINMTSATNEIFSVLIFEKGKKSSEYKK